jgi:lipid-binding SYLF domain-containing protein
VLGSTALGAVNKEQGRLENCGVVMQEVLDIPDNIPQELLEKAECVIVIPSMTKVAVGFGGSYGRGAMVCRTGRTFNGPWGAPAMYSLEGGSFGLQLGGESTDVVLLVMNNRGAEALLSSTVKLGANMSAAAGPKGRNAEASTDATLRAEILSYSRARGLFAGVSLEGTSLRPDDDASEQVYGRKLTARTIVMGDRQCRHLRRRREGARGRRTGWAGRFDRARFHRRALRAVGRAAAPPVRAARTPGGRPSVSDCLVDRWRRAVRGASSSDVRAAAVGQSLKARAGGLSRTSLKCRPPGTLETPRPASAA